MKTQTYTAIKALPFRGRVVQPGETVSLHPRQAKYYIGTHLERPKPAKPAPKGGKGAAKQPAPTEAQSEGGDS